jgi:hypothetical protein
MQSRGKVTLVVICVLVGTILVVSDKTAAVGVTVPYSSTPVADADLDGDPSTGAWGDAQTTTVPLENGETGGYGEVTFYTKHDGTTAFFRADGEIDIPWTDTSTDWFWFAFQLSDTGTNHHGGGGTSWDGAFFGLWNGAEYTPEPTSPPAVVDTNSFPRPPDQDASQDLTGAMDYSGASAPYDFTAEWKKALNTGDADDLVYVADGTTTYNFFMTTDSDDGGSSGTGNINHHQTTNTNTIVFATPPAPNDPPTVDLTDPDGGEDWTGGSAHTVWWNMSDTETATANLLVWLNYSTDGGGSWSTIPAVQGASGFSTPSTYAWTVPTVDTVQARVNVDVEDEGGKTATDMSAANFFIDSTGPTVSAVTGSTSPSASRWTSRAPRPPRPCRSSPRGARSPTPSSAGLATCSASSPRPS